MKLYLCFCENFYTGDDVGQWYPEKPDTTKCHEQDGCGMYTVEMDDPYECSRRDEGGAICGYPIDPKTDICRVGHKGVDNDT